MELVDELVQKSLDWLELHGINTSTFVARWSEPQRKYHALEPHMIQGLSAVAEVSEFYSLNDSDLLQLLLGLWYHDIVYDVGNPNNEMSSADTAWREIENVELARLVRRDVLRTKDHTHPRSFPGALLLDIDLHGLGIIEYWRNGVLVREEYGLAEDDPLWLEGRRKFLTGMLERKVIYHTSWGARFEETARRNMERDLARLVPGGVKAADITVMEHSCDPGKCCWDCNRHTMPHMGCVMR